MKITQMGARGPRGERGERGEAGERGPKGDPGASAVDVSQWPLLIVSRLAINAGNADAAFQQLPDFGFTMIQLTEAPTFDNKQAFNRSTSIYTIPETGVYHVQGKLRLNDRTPDRISYGLGIDTDNVDGPGFQWGITVAAGPGSGMGNGGVGRYGIFNTRFMFLQAGAPLRLFAISTGASVGIVSAELTVRRIA